MLLRLLPVSLFPLLFRRVPTTSRRKVSVYLLGVITTQHAMLFFASQIYLVASLALQEDQGLADPPKTPYP